jgi:hypothetical protein
MTADALINLVLEAEVTDLKGRRDLKNFATQLRSQLKAKAEAKRADYEARGWPAKGDQYHDVLTRHGFTDNGTRYGSLTKEYSRGDERVTFGPDLRDGIEWSHTPRYNNRMFNRSNGVHHDELDRVLSKPKMSRVK